MDNIDTCPMGSEEGAALKDLLNDPKHDSKMSHHKRSTLEGDRSQGSHQESTVEKVVFFFSGKPTKKAKPEVHVAKKQTISALHVLCFFLINNHI